MPAPKRNIAALVVILFFFLVGWMRVVRGVFPAAPPPSNNYDLYKGVAIEKNIWLEPWQRWDTLHYQAIAERGYTSFDTALFTPPLYPFLMRGINLLVNNSLASGLMISFICALFAAHTMYQLAFYETQNAESSFRALIYLFVFPTSFFLFAAYTESLFIWSASACLLALRQRKWGKAGIWSGIAALSRSIGILIFIPLVYQAFQEWRVSRDIKPYLGMLFAPMLTLIFPLLAWMDGGFTPFDILHAVGRGGEIAAPFTNIIEALRRIYIGQIALENIIELAFTFLFCGLIIFSWDRLPRLYGIYCATFMLLFLSRMGEPQPLVSMTRYVLTFFPLFIPLARWGQDPRINRVILYTSFAGLVFFSAQFSIWGWVG